MRNSPGDIVDQRTTIRLIDISNLGIRHRLRASGIQRIEDLPVIILPALITGDTVCVEDALQGLRVRAVRGVFDEVSVLGGFSTVCGIIV